MLEAEIDYFSMNLDTGKQCRFPAEFVRSYVPLPEVIGHVALCQQSCARLAANKMRRGGDQKTMSIRMTGRPVAPFF